PAVGSAAPACLRSSLAVRFASFSCCWIRSPSYTERSSCKRGVWRRLHRAHDRDEMRRLHPAEIELDKLHMVLQDALGWTNSHLHQFIIGDDEQYAEWRLR